MPCCPNGGARHLMHHGRIKTLRGIVEESEVPKGVILEESRGVRHGDATSPRDLAVLDFATEGKHLIIDGSVTSLYRNCIISRVAAAPGFAAKQAEDMEFKVDADSPTPGGATNQGCHTFVPFALEDGGRMGANARAALRMLAEYAVSKGRLPPSARHKAPLCPSWL